MKVTVGIPAYNEEKNIARIIVNLKKIADTIIVCNDGSSDSTSEIAQSLGAIVVDHPKNMGYGAGINSIFRKAKEIDTEILVTFDADGQHRIDDIEKVIQPIKENMADLVIGSRFLGKGKEKIPEYRRFWINVITKVTNSKVNQKTNYKKHIRAHETQTVNK